MGQEADLKMVSMGSSAGGAAARNKGQAKNNSDGSASTDVGRDKTAKIFASSVHSSGSTGTSANSRETDEGEWTSDECSGEDDSTGESGASSTSTSTSLSSASSSAQVVDSQRAARRRSRPGA
jgi:hypothetical protein